MRMSTDPPQVDSKDEAQPELWEEVGTTWKPTYPREIASTLIWIGVYVGRVIPCLSARANMWQDNLERERSCMTLVT